MVSGNCSLLISEFAQKHYWYLVLNFCDSILGSPINSVWETEVAIAGNIKQSGIGYIVCPLIAVVHLKKFLRSLQAIIAGINWYAIPTFENDKVVLLS